MAELLGAFALAAMIYSRQRVDCPVGPRQVFGLDRDAHRDRGGDVPLVSMKGNAVYYPANDLDFSTSHPKPVNPRLYADGSCRS